MFGSFNALCQSTIGHFGWVDSNGDGVPDPVNPAGKFGTQIEVEVNPQSTNPDVWVRIQDDGEAPGNQIHQNPRSGSDNYVYARIKNFGNVTAEIVRVDFYIENYSGADLIFPNDYNNRITAPDIPYPMLFLLRPGASLVVKTRWPKAQVPPRGWNSACLLVHVSCAQDRVVPDGSKVKNSKHLAQRNIVID
jgi:hypothetical protein